MVFWIMALLLFIILLTLDEIIKVIENKVFECKVDTKVEEDLMAHYPIINIRQEGASTFLRLVSDGKPVETAISVIATLEDLYLYYFSEVSHHE